MAVNLSYSQTYHPGVGVGSMPMMGGLYGVSASGTPDFGASDARYQAVQQARYASLGQGPQNPYLGAGNLPGAVQDPHSKTIYQVGHPQYEEVKRRAEEYRSGATQSALTAANQAQVAARDRFLAQRAPAPGMMVSPALTGLQQAGEAQTTQDTYPRFISRSQDLRQGIGTRTPPSMERVLTGLRTY